MQNLTFICFLLFLFSCTKDHSSPNQSGNNQSGGQSNSEPVYSIVRGNYWVYRDSSFHDDGSFSAAFPADTLKTTDSIAYEGKVFYGTDTFYIADDYYRQANDSTIERYIPGESPYIFFRQVKENNTIIWSQDVIFSNERLIYTQTGYTDVIKMYGYDCIKNELTQTTSGILDLKDVVYVKPGVGVIRYARYIRNKSTGQLNPYFTRTLVSYKVE